MSEEKTMQLDEFLSIDENIDIDESYQEKQDPEFQKIKLAEVGELCEAAEKQQILVQELSQKLKDEEAKLRELLEIKIPETLESVGLKELKLTSGKKISIVDELAFNISEKNKPNCMKWLRDNNFDRIEKCYDAMVIGTEVKEAKEVWKNSQSNGITDEFIIPTTTYK